MTMCDILVLARGYCSPKEAGHEGGLWARIPLPKAVAADL